MAAKFVVFAALVTVASAGVISGQAATSHASISQHHTEGHHGHAAPAVHYAHVAPVAHYAAPIHKTIIQEDHHVPAATSHSSVTHHHVQSHHDHAAPVLHYAAPAVHVAHAAPVAHHAAPVHKVIAVPVHKTIVEEHHAPAHYEFEYSVHDPHTGDIKSQKESRQGDAVHGSYSLVEPDGSKRIVEYTADKHSGFNAIVHREPAKHPVAHKVVAPIAVHAVHAAPVHSYYHH